MKRVVMAVLALSTMAACGGQIDTSRSEQTRKEAEMVYGKPGPTSAPEAFASSADGAGMSMFRVFSEKPMPTRFSRRAPEMFDNSLVVDVAVDMKLEQGFPIYRIGVVPQRLEDMHTATWESHVRIQIGGAATNVLAARLPTPSWPPGEDSVIWSDWTYCADCFDLKDIEKATPATRTEAFAALNEARAAAMRPDGAGRKFAGDLRFTGLPEVGILQGEAALRMAKKAAVLITQSEERMAAMAPAREDYARAVTQFKQSANPANEIKRICGTYAPNTELQDPQVEKDRFTAYQTCGRQVVENFDRPRRQDAIAAFAALEARLAAKAGFTAEERVIVPGIGEEMAEAREMLRDAESRYRGREVRRGDTVSTTMAPRMEPFSKNVDTVALVDQARRAIESTPRSVPRDAPKPSTSGESADPDTAPEREVHYVARLLPDGANMERGSDGGNCIADLPCETGSIVATIAATGYCREPGELSETSAGWGLVVQRYLPETRAEEQQLMSTKETQVQLVRADDETALKDGIAQMRGLTDPETGKQVFFTSYQSFYEVNTDEMGCRDEWRDAARNRVLSNPEEVVKN